MSITHELLSRADVLSLGDPEYYGPALLAFRAMADSIDLGTTFISAAHASMSLFSLTPAEARAVASVEFCEQDGSLRLVFLDAC